MVSAEHGHNMDTGKGQGNPGGAKVGRPSDGLERMIVADRRLSVIALLALTACGGQPTPASTVTPTESASASPASVTVICDAFAEGGPVDLTTEAVIGNLTGENVTATTRSAIAGYEELAERATGDEREDLLAIADTMDAAELDGQGVMGWNDASEAFYVKYAEQCGFEVAP